MPGGILIESGQADSCSSRGSASTPTTDGERVYRLLGCDLTSHGEQPLPGPATRSRTRSTFDGHAVHGDVRLFFFHYDCRVNGDLRVSVRDGQAGFFTDEELDDSAGILWPR